jgi:hypothetical protein
MLEKIRSQFNKKNLATVTTTFLNLLALSYAMSVLTPFLPISPFNLLCLTIPSIRLAYKFIDETNIPKQLKEIGIDNKNRFMMGILGLMAGHLTLSLISPYFSALGMLNLVFLADFAVLAAFTALCIKGIQLVLNSDDNSEKNVFTASLLTCSLYAVQQIASGLLLNFPLPGIISAPLGMIVAIPSPLIGLALLGFAIYHLHFYAVELPSQASINKLILPATFLFNTLSSIVQNDVKPVSEQHKDLDSDQKLKFRSQV